MNDLPRTAEPTLDRSRLGIASDAVGPSGRGCRWCSLLLAGALVGAGYWYMTKDEETTDDAYTDGQAITIAPQVAGDVIALDVTDNQRVKAGDRC